MTIKRGNTGAVTRKIGRSKLGVDLMYRLWDAHNSCWMSINSRSIWSSKLSVEKIREAQIKAGRDPATISVERVFVLIDPGVMKDASVPN
ncbi:hypothetical protein [Xanthomonas phage JGB6]|nr:hypothetical protein [Xanthomonas phage JGB6]